MFAVHLTLVMLRIQNMAVCASEVGLQNTVGRAGEDGDSDDKEDNGHY